MRRPWVVAVAPLLLACPTDKPVLPSPPAAASTSGSTTATTSTGLVDGSSSSGPGTTAGTTTGTTTGTTGPGSDSTSGGPPVCELMGEACGAPATPWWNPSWAHRREITITSPLVVPLTDAVIPVRLPAEFELPCAQEGGADLRVVDDADTVYPHEIDEWGPEQGGVLWVRLSTLDPGEHTLWLYYGNPDAPEPAGEVWPNTLGLQTVLHMGGDLDDARGVHPGRPAVDGAMPQYVSDGLVGQAVHYEGILVNARAELEGSSFIDDALVADGALTMTAWVRSTPAVQSPSPFRAVVSRGTPQWAMVIQDVEGDFDFLPPAYPLFFSRCAAMECVGLVDGNDNHFVTGTVSVIEDPVVAQWHHLAMVYEDLGGGSYAKRLYVDGLLDVQFEGTLPFSWESIPLDGSPITIGAGPTDPTTTMFHGEIDEVHLASDAWSAERIQAEHDFAIELGLVVVGSAECI